MKKTILVTGGSGYIGSHTIVDLIENGYDAISIDNLSHSDGSAFDGIFKITGKRVTNYRIDLSNADAVKSLYNLLPPIQGVIHFAAYKSVPESVAKPVEYYRNNIFSLINILSLVKELNIPGFIFSSSCSVYGNPDKLPVDEQTPLKEALSPYAATKEMGERITRDFAVATKVPSILLRYFNPVGAHPSALIGEASTNIPDNLIPVVCQNAAGLRSDLTVYGTDYNTRDGSCVRDYIHVSDIAHAHTLSIEYSIKHPNMKYDIFNLGSGNGFTVLEVLNAFEKVNKLKLNYKLGPRRQGDVIAVYSDNKKAINDLNWRVKYSLEEMMRSAWQWQQSLKK